MGNEMDVCSKDTELDEYFEREHGPAKETIWQFITRSSDRLCTRVAKPQRHQYDMSELRHTRYCSPIYSLSSHVSWEESEFKFPSFDWILQGYLWRVKVSRPGQAEPIDMPPNPVCIVYLHTNLRSMVDTLEILPVAASLGASIISLDWPGCGKSGGGFHGRMDKDLEPLFEWAKALLGDDVQIVLWARGMGTAIAVGLLARLCSPSPAPRPPEPPKKSRFSFTFFGSKTEETPPLPDGAELPAAAAAAPTGGGAMSAGPVKVVVLDSPFTAMQDLVKAAIKRMHGNGFALTRAIIQWGAKRMLNQLSQKLGGLDLFSIQPILQAPRIRTPAFILSADSDDYIPVDHGAMFASKWGGPVKCATFSGRHFGQRPADVVLSTVSFIASFLEIEPFATPPGPVTAMLMASIRPVDLAAAEQHLQQLKAEEEGEEEEVLPSGTDLQYVDLEEMVDESEADSILRSTTRREAGAVGIAEEASNLSRLQTYPSFGRGLQATASVPHLAGLEAVGSLQTGDGIAMQRAAMMRTHSLSSLALRGMR